MDLNQVVYQVKFQSLEASPYSPSRLHETPKLDRELADAYEQRTWREKAHTRNGHVAIPANQFKAAISEAAKSLGLQIPGKGKRTYTQVIKSGIFLPEDLILPLKKEDLEPIAIWCNAQGKSGVGSRVKRIFPEIKEWQGTITIVVLDELITREVLDIHLVQAGTFVGIGRWRPAVGGYNGRFAVKDCKVMKK